MSTTLTWYSCASRAPTLASVSGSLSQICTASGRGFSGDAPQAVGVFGFVLVEPDEPAGVDHLGRQQTGAAELAHDLPEGVVGEPRHRRLQDRRINDQITDVERGTHGNGCGQWATGGVSRDALVPQLGIKVPPEKISPKLASLPSCCCKKRPSSV